MEIKDVDDWDLQFLYYNIFYISNGFADTSEFSEFEIVKFG